MSRTIEVHNQYTDLSYNEEEITELFNALDTVNEYSIVAGEISIAFMGDREIESIHSDFMNDPTPTDVITFKGDPSMGFAGEICVSIDYALSSGKEHNNSLASEITLYLVHGWLHLAGLNDLETNDRMQMRQAESNIMKFLSENKLIPSFKISKQR